MYYTSMAYSCQAKVIIIFSLANIQLSLCKNRL
nr:MAG TPA: hypothetical protein [Caudoviricetes sp.]DAX07358.1 MAG TPA: hypothetical protein [Bacteriophage sp.]